MEPRRSINIFVHPPTGLEWPKNGACHVCGGDAEPIVQFGGDTCDRGYYTDYGDVAYVCVACIRDALPLIPQATPTEERTDDAIAG